MGGSEPTIINTCSLPNMQDNANHWKKLCPRKDLKKSLCSDSKPSKVTKIFTPWTRTSPQHSLLGPRSSTSRVRTWSQQFERLASKIFVVATNLPELKELLVN